MSIWNDLPSLVRLKAGFDVAAITLGILVALAAGLAWIVDRRAGVLRAIQERSTAETRDKAAADMQQRLEESRAREETLRTDLAATQRVAEEAKVEAIQSREHAHRLQEAARPRTLTIDQRLKLRRALAGTRGVLHLTCPMTDAEAHDFAEEIGAVFAEAGWSDSTPVYGALAGRPEGLLLSARSATDPYAMVVQRAFASIGIEAPARFNPNLAEGAVSLLVGHKPR